MSEIASEIARETETEKEGWGIVTSSVQVTFLKVCHLDLLVLLVVVVVVVVVPDVFCPVVPDVFGPVLDVSVVEVSVVGWRFP